MNQLPATDLRTNVLTLAVPNERLPGVGRMMRSLLPAEDYDPVTDNIDDIDVAAAVLRGEDGQQRLDLLGLWLAALRQHDDLVESDLRVTDPVHPGQ